MTKTKLKLHRRRNGEIDLARAYEDAGVERRKGMSDADCWRDVLEELRETAELRTTLYQNELRKPRPRINVLIRIWCDHREDMELCMWGGISPEDQQAFKSEMVFADQMIDRLAEPYLQRMLTQ
jgi:hypothetical protein